MAKAKNKVIAGDYLNKPVIGVAGIPLLAINFKDEIRFNNDTVAKYELITDEHRKSAASGVARGLVGGAILGPVGMLAGGISAKSKGIYHLAIEFQDGKKSLIEVDDKIYKLIVKSCF